MIEQGFVTLLHLSAQAALVGLVIWLVKALLGRRLTPPFHYFIWLLVFIKLTVPIPIASSWSLFNIGSGESASVSWRVPQVQSTGSDETAPQDIDANTPIAPNADAVPVMPETSQPRSVWGGLALLSRIWFAVASLSLVCLVWNYLRLKRNVYKGQATEIDSIYEEAFASCCAKSNGLADAKIVFTSYAKTPFVFGFFEPLIVFPSGLLSGLSLEEYKAIVRHEAMHIQLHHHKIKLITSAISIVYWFNPFIWLFGKAMQNDAEMHCDNAVIRKSGDAEENAYLQAMLKVAQHRPHNAVTLLHFGQSNLRRRVHHIMNRKSIPNYAFVLSVVLTIVLAITLLTTAKANNDSVASPSEVNNDSAASPSETIFDAASINTVKIRADAATVQFVQATDSKITIGLDVRDEYASHYTLENKVTEAGVLDISLRNTAGGISLSPGAISLGPSAILTIALPQYELDRLDISLNASNAILDSFTVAQLAVSLNAGNIELVNNAIGALACLNNAGTMTMQTETLDFDFDIAANAGIIEITTQSRPADMHLHIKATVGHIELPSDWDYQETSQLADVQYDFTAGNGTHKGNITCTAGSVIIK